MTTEYFARLNGSGNGKRNEARWPAISVEFGNSGGQRLFGAGHFHADLPAHQNGFLDDATLPHVDSFDPL